MKLTLMFNMKDAVRAIRKLKMDAARANERCLKKAVMVTIERDAKKVYGQGHPGTPVKTGTLRRSIHSEITQRTLKRVQVQTGTNVNYAFFVHQGHHTRGGGRFIEGRPFLYGALRSQFPACNRAYAKYMKEATGL